jgi:hypothetical protein
MMRIGPEQALRPGRAEERSHRPELTTEDTEEMAVLSEEIRPGLVLAVATSGTFGDLIRLGSEILDEPAAQSHIAVVDHKDGSTGRWWGIEGRPGGVGWRDLSDYLRARETIANIRQPLDTGQQALICSAMRQTLGTKYDWDAIMQDAARDLHLEELWADTDQWDSNVPAHVVCSSVAAWAYARAVAAYPRQADERHIEPTDWVQFIQDNNFG